MKTAIITGGAGGLGRALSTQLQASGWRVISMDLEAPALEGSDTLYPVKCDLTDGDSLKNAVDGILLNFPQIDLVIYNAGITQIGAFGDGDDASHRKVFEINYFAAISMARLLLPALRKNQGTHLAISSVAGFSPLYHRTAYAASKHALEGFFKSLKSEEKIYGVKVAIASPSFVATNIGNADRQDNGIARPGSADDGKDYMTADAAATEILKGLEKGNSRILVGRIARLSWWINGLFPGLYYRLMEKQISGDRN